VLRDVGAWYFIASKGEGECCERLAAQPLCQEEQVVRSIWLGDALCEAEKRPLKLPPLRGPENRWDGRGAPRVCL
jgi:hypothetical protein